MNQLARVLSYMMFIPALALTTAACVPEDDEPDFDSEELGEAEQEASNGNGSPVVGNGFIHFTADIPDEHDHEHPEIRNSIGFALRADGSLKGGGSNQVLLEGPPDPIALKPMNWFFVEENAILICYSYTYLKSGEVGDFCGYVEVSDRPSPVDVNGDGIDDGIAKLSMR